MSRARRLCRGGMQARSQLRSASIAKASAAPRDPALATDGLDAPGIVVRQVVHPRPPGQLGGHGHIPRQGSKAGGGRAAI